MEKLLHYVWQHRLYSLAPLLTTDGLPVEVSSLHNDKARACVPLDMTK